MSKSKIIISFLFAVFCINFSFAKYGVWGLDNIDIISREEWGADDKMLFADYKDYVDYLKRADEYAKYVEGLKDTNPTKYQQIQNAKEKENRRNDYLVKNFLDEISIDKTIKTLSGNVLWWNFMYKDNKTKFIIHHTANDGSRFENAADVKVFMRNLQKFHSLTNLWGDIGYNFLIDKFGNIYEGKAGGAGVVGAHAMRNNVQSVGIALIGNYEKEDMTQSQIDSLTTLLTELSKKYNINPTNQVYYHKTLDNPEILMQDVLNYTIVGHRDAGHTTCPGKFVYEKLADIRNKVAENLSKPVLTSSQSSIQPKIIKKSLNKRYMINGNNYVLKIKAQNLDFDGKCELSNSNIKVIGCEYSNNFLRINLKYVGPKASGYSWIIIKGKKNTYQIKLKMLWTKEFDSVTNNSITSSGVNTVIQNNSNSTPIPISSGSTITTSVNTGNTKISYKIDLQETKQLLSQNIKVLLYDLTTSYTGWDIKCDNKCLIKLDGSEFDSIEGLKVVKTDSQLRLTLGGLNFVGKKLEIINNNGFISFENYDRKSYAGIPWNIFRGNILIYQDKIKPLNQDLKTDFVIVNELKFDDYMKGIAETTDSQSLEKIKAMSLIIKGYTLFYVNKKNRHPSIPQDAYYNAIDDARIFQKYVGAGFEKTVKNWYIALDATKNSVILYDNYIPILPYFNCSAGNTISAKDKYGWTDTPYLKSKEDFAKCETLNGHGVGLSGQGAEYLANIGWDFKKIIQYYYDGVQIVDF